MLKTQNENCQLVDIGELCNLKLNCCYLEWKMKIHFCSSSFRRGNELLINGEDGEEVISLRSATNFFVLSKSEDEDDIDVFKIMEVIE